VKLPVKLCLIFLCLSTHVVLAQQNFVPNGSFETYTTCPQRRNDGVFCPKWDAPTDGTADYFNSCAPYSNNNSGNSVSVPNNFGGNQAARTGNAYSGIYASQDFVRPNLEYREYMQVTMDSLLIAGGTYTFTMYLNLSDKSNYASNKVGAYISKIAPSSNSDTYLAYTPQIISSTYITDKNNWVKVTGEYIATGGEKYITIGVFEPAASNTKIAVPGGSQQNDGVSYYYIDDVSLTRACDIPATLLRDTVACINTGEPLLISVMDTATHAYLWNTGETSKTINAPLSGKYIVKVTSLFCTVNDTMTVTRKAIPAVNLGNDVSVCGAVDTLLKSGLSGKSYLWNTGNTTENLRVVSAGKYYVTVTDNGCKAADTVSVFSLPIPVVSLGNDLFICGAVNTLLKSGLPGKSYLWNTGAITENLLVTADGTYYVTVTDNGCMATDTVSVFSSPATVLQLGNDTASCFQSSSVINSPVTADTYLWSTGSNLPSITVSKAGMYWLEITKGYCTVRDSIRYSQKTIPTLNLGPDRKICKEQTIQIDLTQPSTSYAWQDGNSNSTRVLSAPGVFVVSVKSDDGCRVSDSLVLDTFTSPVIDLGADTAICTNSDLLLSVAGNFVSYKWQDGSTAATYSATKKGNYTVDVTDGNGCKTSDALTLGVLSLPVVNLMQELRICDPDTFVDVSGNFASVLWNDGTSSARYPITEYGTFTVTATSENNCSNSAAITVINNCPGKVYVPNVFTPSNRDGLNDAFIPVTRNVESINFQVFNRWGEKVFETDKLLEGWNGQFEGKPAQADVYVYTVQYKTFGGLTGSTSGNVTLLK
jgi:gliding motility-associated-like protein